MVPDKHKAKVKRKFRLYLQLPMDSNLTWIPFFLLKALLALPDSKCRKSLDFATLFHLSALLVFFSARLF